VKEMYVGLCCCGSWSANRARSIVCMSSCINETKRE